MERKTVTCITINTDASFNFKEKASGYAFHIICDVFKIQKGGIFNNIQPKTALEAEIMCIGNAIATLLKHPDLPKSKCIVLNSDCTFAMNNIQNNKTKISRKVNKLWLSLIKETGSHKSSMRHVKAHSDLKDKRSLANEWCDQEAKKWMRIHVKKIKAKNGQG